MDKCYLNRAINMYRDEEKTNKPKEETKNAKDTIKTMEQKRASDRD